MTPPSSVIKIVKYSGVWGGGGGGIACRQNPTKDNGAPSLCHYKIVKYCSVGGWGGINYGAPKSYTDNGAPSPCHQGSQVL